MPTLTLDSVTPRDVLDIIMTDGDSLRAWEDIICRPVTVREVAAINDIATDLTADYLLRNNPDHGVILYAQHLEGLPAACIDAEADNILRHAHLRAVALIAYGKLGDV